MQINLSKIQPYIDDKMVSVQKHPLHELYIYNYTQKAQFAQNWDDVTKMCRGLITDKRGNVVARPFDKFFNLSEMGETINIAGDNLTFKAWDKFDGSLGILFKSPDGHEIATRGSFKSDQAIFATKLFKEIETKHYIKIDPDLTYLFEIIYPENRIVVDYGDAKKLVLIGARNIETGAVFAPDELPEMNTIFETSKTIGDYSTPRDNSEGVVIYFQDGTMVKVKYEEYVRLHRLVTGVNARRVWECLKEGTGTKEMLERVPEEFADWIKKTTKGLQNQFDWIYSRSKYDYRRVIDRVIIHYPLQFDRTSISPASASSAMTLDFKEFDKIQRTMQKAINSAFEKCEYPTILHAMHTRKSKKQIVEMVWEMIRPAHETPFKKEVQ